MLDWNDLRYFLAVTRAGSLAGAGKALGVEHTTVGRRLGALETALGTKLFTRSPDGLALTRAGQEILSLSEEIGARAEAIERRVAGEDTRVAGSVRLTASEAVSTYLAARLPTLNEQYPDLMVEILSGNRAYDLLRGEADLAVRVREVTEPDLLTRKLAEAGWSLYASGGYLARKGSIENLESLTGHEVVGYDDSLGAVPGALWLAEHAAGAKTVLRGNSIVAALNAVTFGVGIGALPCFMADAEPRLQRLTERVVGVRPIFMVVHPDLARVARVRAVMDFLIDVFTKDAALWSGQQVS
ncbi:MAG TPA: LysR family transcriptional regulator [Polyangiaceae bacterium]|nr:LysR family transcriptional regulator [Polyangiaceae bacterium]